MKLKIGDRVEVLFPPEEEGVQGVITAEYGRREVIVKITRAGKGHNTIKLIGKKLPYFPTDLKGI